ncbi:MAG TPA: dTMP kinase [bacterium]|nr:dTMP kinase [bacterium]HOL46583.1 dTMP kinase [bacterium]HPQ17846.1 dTMP kinase [bacterium]
MKAKKGIFITFEGPEGSGKTTQANLLIKYFKKKGREVIYTREPGGTKISEQIRNILLDKKNKEMDKYTELLLYIASRRQLVAEKIEKELKSGKVIICDRFTDASLAYQGYGRGIDLNFIIELNNIATNNRKPDITFLMDIEIEEGLNKTKNIDKKHSKKGEMDRIEAESLKFHQKVRNGYRKIMKKEPERICLIKVNKSIEEIHKKIVELIEQKIKNI